MNSTKVPAFRYVGPAAGLMPALQAARIELRGRLTPEQVAEHNRFIDEMRDQTTQDFVTAQSRFVGVTRELPISTCI